MKDDYKKKRVAVLDDMAEFEKNFKTLLDYVKCMQDNLGTRKKIADNATRRESYKLNQLIKSIEDTCPRNAAAALGSIMEVMRKGNKYHCKEMGDEVMYDGTHPLNETIIRGDHMDLVPVEISRVLIETTDFLTIIFGSMVKKLEAADVTHMAPQD